MGKNSIIFLIWKNSFWLIDFIHSVPRIAFWSTIRAYLLPVKLSLHFWFLHAFTALHCDFFINYLGFAQPRKFIKKIEMQCRKRMQKPDVHTSLKKGKLFKMLFNSVNAATSNRWHFSGKVGDILSNGISQNMLWPNWRKSVHWIRKKITDIMVQFSDKH